MENILKYYEFTDFFEDLSSTFSGNEICYTIINEHHFLIFEKTNNDEFNLYVSKYTSKNLIGKETPEIIELLVKNYDKSIPKHRIILRNYIE